MRKIIILVACLAFFLGSCSSKPTEANESIAVTTGTMVNWETSPPSTSAPISKGDLCFWYKGEEVWKIFAPFSKLRIPNTSVVSRFLSPYELYVWKENESTIEVCNFYFDKWGMEADSFYVRRIVTKNIQYHTTRNICVGNTMKDVVKSYGDGAIIGTKKSDFYIITYYLDGRDHTGTLGFWLDQNEVVYRIDISYDTYPLSLAENSLSLDGGFWP